MAPIGAPTVSANRALVSETCPARRIPAPGSTSPVEVPDRARLRLGSSEKMSWWSAAPEVSRPDTVAADVVVGVSRVTPANGAGVSVPLARVIDGAGGVEPPEAKTTERGAGTSATVAGPSTTGSSRARRCRRGPPRVWGPVRGGSSGSRPPPEARAPADPGSPERPPRGARPGSGQPRRAGRGWWGDPLPAVSRARGRTPPRGPDRRAAAAAPRPAASDRRPGGPTGRRPVGRPAAASWADRRSALPRPAADRERLRRCRRPWRTRAPRAR